MSLKRAYETALIIKGDREIPIIKEDRIIEISFGEYEGLSYSKDKNSLQVCTNFCCILNIK